MSVPGTLSAPGTFKFKSDGTGVGVAWNGDEGVEDSGEEPVEPKLNSSVEEGRAAAMDCAGEDEREDFGEVMVEPKPKSEIVKGRSVTLG
jgi:hypothetical protein